MDNIKKIFKNVKLDDKIFYGDWKCAETPDKNGDFVSRIVAWTIMEYSIPTLWYDEEIKEWRDKKLIELSPNHEYELNIEGVKVLKIVYGDDGECSVDIEITFEVVV